MPNATDAINFIEAHQNRFQLVWINTDRSGSDWKARIYEQVNSNTQLALYDRKTSIQVLTERRLPSIEGVTPIVPRPISDALNYSRSHFRDGMGNCYVATDIPSLERLLVTYLQSEQPMNQAKREANVQLTEEPTAASLAVSGLELDAETVKSLALPDKLRQQRLALADRVPRKITVETTVFLRNPDVVAEVLIRANGFCEICECAAPFLRRSDALPYLEVHHSTRLADGGEDSVKNAVAACPNCHRQAHFG